MPDSTARPISNRVALARTSIVRPIIEAYRASGFDPDAILQMHQLNEKRISDPDVFITHDTVYSIYNAVAESTGPDFCARAGHMMEWKNIVPFWERLSQAATLGDFFTTFVIAVSKESNSARQTFFVEEDHAYFVANRLVRPTVSPAQTDAFQVSVWLAMIHRVLDFRWDPARVLVRIMDPAVIPKDLHGVHPIRCDQQGFSLRFPAQWLSCPVKQSAIAPFTQTLPNRMTIAPKGLLQSVQDVIRSRIGVGTCTTRSVAEACGYSESALNRRLAKHNITISKVISGVYFDFAKRNLGATDRTVSEIASDLGYSDPTAFSRAFRGWSGQSPAAFRKAQQNAGFEPYE